MGMIFFMAMRVLCYFCVPRSKMIGFAETRELLEIWCDSDGQMYKNTQNVDLYNLNCVLYGGNSFIRKCLIKVLTVVTIGRWKEL